MQKKKTQKSENMSITWYSSTLQTHTCTPYITDLPSIRLSTWCVASPFLALFPTRETGQVTHGGVASSAFWASQKPQPHPGPSPPSRPRGYLPPPQSFPSGVASPNGMECPRRGGWFTQTHTTSLEQSAWHQQQSIGCARHNHMQSFFLTYKPGK